MGGRQGRQRNGEGGRCLANVVAFEVVRHFAVERRVRARCKKPIQYARWLERWISCHDLTSCRLQSCSDLRKQRVCPFKGSPLQSKRSASSHTFAPNARTIDKTVSATACRCGRDSLLRAITILLM